MKILKFNESMNNELHLTKVAVMNDNYLNVPYTLNTCSAKELSNYLKVNVAKRNLDLDSFNSDKQKNNFFDKDDLKTEKNPPLEIYEYQPFFLIKDEKGEYFLCDGFKRLLWFTPPEHTIQVRVYDKKDVSDDKILKLLVNLNHFKFFGGMGSYYDRGFSLLLKLVFNLTIQKYSAAFDAYLSKKELVKSYSSERSTSATKNLSVKERILNPMFISDIRFIEDITNDPKTMNNKFLGVLVYSLRQKHPDATFDSATFLKLQNENKVLLEQLTTYEKYGDTDSEYSRKVINKIIPLYTNIFITMLGGEVEETYADKLNKAKGLMGEMKKKKEFVNLTGSRNKYVVEKQIDEYVKEHKKSPKVKIVVHPNERGHDVLPVGIYDFKFSGYQESGRSIGKKIKYIFTSLDGKIVVGGSRMNNYHSSQAFDEITIKDASFSDRAINNIDLFISFE